MVVSNMMKMEDVMALYIVSSSVLVLLLLVWLLGLLIHYRHALHPMHPPMAVMGITMVAGLWLGLLLDLLLHLSYLQLTFITMIVVILVGCIVGFPFGYITVVEGFMTGMMSGMMGAMFSYMLSAETKLIAFQTLSVIVLTGMFMLHLMVTAALAEKNKRLKQASFYAFLSILIFLVSTHFIF